jgi:hypothetical protein
MNILLSSNTRNFRKKIVSKIIRTLFPWTGRSGLSANLNRNPDIPAFFIYFINKDDKTVLWGGEGTKHGLHNGDRDVEHSCVHQGE